MKRIIFIQHEPLTPNIEKRYCIDALIDAGFDVSYWDISQIIYPGLKCADELERGYSQRLFTIEELEIKCKSISEKDIVVPEFFFIVKNKKIWQIVTSTNAIRVKIECYGNSNPEYTFVQKVIMHLRPTKAITFIKNYLFYNYCKKHSIIPYDKVITSSYLQKGDFRRNHPDYDDYLLNKDIKPFVKGKYICFIDTGFGIHPDDIFYKNDKFGNNELWQTKLNAFFDFLEKKYSMPVVIAVHPKINYPVTAFAGREKIKYKTLNLVLNSEFIIQDISNSLSFSIMADKKIRLITTNEMYKSQKQYLINLSRRIGIPLFNIDKNNWNSFEPVQIEESIRNEYIHNFLCSKGNENRQSADIIVEYLKTL